MIALKLQNVSKYYTSQNSVVMALADVNLSFSEGEFVAVTGENGSGKSTLANVIGGIIPYESGELYIMGQPTSHYDAADWERYRRDMISYISQDYGILPGNTVFENVESALVLSGTDRHEAKVRTREILRKVELLPYSRKRASKLSSGQKQRLAIARALAKPSKILIADEPTGNLDRENSDKVIRLLKEASEDRLVILITHEFDEAKDHISRHVILSDGKVVKDEIYAPALDPAESSEVKKNVGAAKPGLSAYVARLTAKTKPIFFIFFTLILLLTCVASFVFVGNFIISTDDVPSRIYDRSGFKNGDKCRLVLAKTDLEEFTDEEIETISKQKYVTKVEKYGYLTDVNYFYRENIDYIRSMKAEFLPEYDKVLNPDAWEYRSKLEFLFNDQLYLQSLSQAGTIKAGRAPEGYYEVLSADPDYKVGSRVAVYISDRMHWPISDYIRITFDIVGEVSEGKGLYFSEDFCKMMNNATFNAIYNMNNVYFSGGSLGKYPVAPYDLERYEPCFVPYPTPTATPTPGEIEASSGMYEETPEPSPTPTPYPEMIGDGDFLFPYSDTYSAIVPGKELYLDIGSGGWKGGEVEEFELVCVGLIDNLHPRFTLVSRDTFERMIGCLGTNQVSVFISDYAYTDRAIDKMEDLGYIAVSPFMQGSTNKDAKLEADRTKLLRFSLTATVLTLVLQLILLTVIFNTLREHFKLLSNIGLRGRTAYCSIALLFIIFTIISELIGLGVILLLNHYGFARVVNIFKYLDPVKIALIFLIHFAFCMISCLFVIRSLRKQVFSLNGAFEDVDGELMEEVMNG